MKSAAILFLALIFVLLQGTNIVAHATTPLPANVVINEIQTNGFGSGTTLQEFIELTNISNVQVDISGYKVTYTNSSSKSYDLITFGLGTFLSPAAHTLMVPVNDTNSFLPYISPKLSYIAPSSSGMAASGGMVTLINSNGIAIDEVKWGNTAAAATGEIIFYGGDGKSIQRKAGSTAVQVTTNPKEDFELLAVPTPESGEPSVAEVPNPEPTITPPAVIDPEIVDSTPVEDSSPAVDTTSSTTIDEPITPAPIYLPIMLNELYIDPASPLTDANDEWVELYNPNEEPVDAAGYVVYTGANFTYKHILPIGTEIPAKSYLILTSADTSLALSNGGGAAKIVSPEAIVFDMVTYDSAPTGQAWAKNVQGLWEWTSTPTQGTENTFNLPLPSVIKAAAVKASPKPKKPVVASAVAKKATIVKAASTKAPAKGKALSSSRFDDSTLIAAPMPIPGWLLAVLISLALLYVGYEYRFEFANSVYRIRKHRSFRR